MLAQGEEFTDKTCEEYIKTKKENVEKILNILSGQPYFFANLTLEAVKNRLETEANYCVYIYKKDN